jgi:hypothetical protein
MTQDQLSQFATQITSKSSLQITPFQNINPPPTPIASSVPITHIIIQQTWYHHYSQENNALTTSMALFQCLCRLNS